MFFFCYRNIGAFCERELVPICANISSSANNELLQQCKSIIDIPDFEYDFAILSEIFQTSYTTEDTTGDTTEDTTVTTNEVTDTTQELIKTTEKSTTESKIKSVDNFKTNFNQNKNEKLVEQESYIDRLNRVKYENIYIVVGGLIVFVVFGIYLTIHMRKRDTPKRRKSVHEKFEPMELECGTLNNDDSNSRKPLDELEQTILMFEEEQKGITQEKVLNEVKMDEQTVQEQVSDPIPTESDDNLSELDESEEQMRRKTIRSVTFDETQNQTRHISCVGISPDPEKPISMDEKDESDQV